MKLSVLNIIVFLALIILTLVSVSLVSNLSNNSKVVQSYSSSEFVTIGDNKINIVIADTDESRMRGLAIYDSLADGEGMLFDFGKKNIFPNFWMKDMKFPIDIIWINDNRIVHIDHNVQHEPGRSDSELTLYTPPKPIDYVLEVSANYTINNGIEIGNSVTINL